MQISKYFLFIKTVEPSFLTGIVKNSSNFTIVRQIKFENEPIRKFLKCSYNVLQKNQFNFFKTSFITGKFLT